MDAVLCSRRVGERLLADDHERALGHATAVDQLLSGGDLRERSGCVHRSRQTCGLARPRHTLRDGEVDLERSRAVAVATVGARDARGQPLTGDLGDRAGRQIEYDRVRRGKLGQRSHPPAGLKVAAVLAHDGGQGA